MPEYLHKAFSEFLVAPLAYFVNLTIQNATVLETWTVSYVTPIPKIANTHNIANLPPISNMRLPYEVFEKAIFMKKIHNLIVHRQHGFIRGRSVDTNLLDFAQHI